MKKLLAGFLALAFAVNLANAQVSNGRVTSAPPTYGNNTTAPLSLNTSGELRTNCGASCATSVIEGTYTDFSGTITAGGVSQQAIAANANRKGFFVQNPSSATEALFVNFTAAAASGNSVELLPGQTLSSTGAITTTEAINVIAATTSHVYVAKELQ